MKYTVLTAFSALLMWVAAFAGERVQSLKLHPITVGNSVLEAEILPDADGRISSLKYRGIEFFSPFKAEKLSGNPLFAPVAANARGWCERFWKRQLGTVPLPVEVLKNSPDHCRLKLDFFGNSELSIIREMRFVPQSAVLEVLSRTSSVKPDDSAAFSFTVFPSVGSGIFFPAMDDKQQSFTASPGAGEGTCRYRPAGNFAWCRFKGKIMAITAEDADFMMSWRARDTADGLERTMEIIGKSRKLPFVWSSRFIFFEKLDTLHAICGARGFEVVGENGRYFVRIEAAAEVKAQRCRFDRYLLELPAQKFGEVSIVPLPGRPERKFPEITLL